MKEKGICEEEEEEEQSNPRMHAKQKQKKQKVNEASRVSNDESGG